jgi:hypothetical protein
MNTPHERLTRTTFLLPFSEGRLFDARVLEVAPNLSHFLHVEVPATIAARIARWLAQRYASVGFAARRDLPNKSRHITHRFAASCEFGFVIGS